MPKRRYNVEEIVRPMEPHKLASNLDQLMRADPVYEMQRLRTDTPMEWVPKRAHPPDTLTMRFRVRSRRRKPGQR